MRGWAAAQGQRWVRSQLLARGEDRTPLVLGMNRASALSQSLAVLRPWFNNPTVRGQGQKGPHQTITLQRTKQGPREEG